MSEPYISTGDHCERYVASGDHYGLFRQYEVKDESTGIPLSTTEAQNPQLKDLHIRILNTIKDLFPKSINSFRINVDVDCNYCGYDLIISDIHIYANGAYSRWRTIHRHFGIQFSFSRQVMDMYKQAVDTYKTQEYDYVETLLKHEVTDKVKETIFEIIKFCNEVEEQMKWDN